MKQWSQNALTIGSDDDQAMTLKQCRSKVIAYTCYMSDILLLA